jgi:hypothetical protein
MPSDGVEDAMQEGSRPGLLGIDQHCLRCTCSRMIPPPMNSTWSATDLRPDPADEPASRR